MTEAGTSLRAALAELAATLEEVLEGHHPRFRAEPVGRVTYVGPGVARVAGLAGVRAEELIRFPQGGLGWAFDIGRQEVGTVLLDVSADLEAGQAAHRTGRVLDVAVGEGLLGRVVDGLGRPLDDRGPVQAAERRAVERPAPGITDRQPVTVPLQTGLKVVDALIPIGRGQRELILGDRQTGKTALAVDAILNQRGRDVLCVYCAIGKRASAAARVIADLRQREAMDQTVVMVTTEENPPGLQFACPYAAMTIGEYFMEHGRDVLIVFDDLTRHARAYREVSLLLRRPPGREAFPGDIFYVHSRLLERSTRLKDRLGGGSLTALPVVETESQNLSAYIPTNLISITDGQIYLSPELFQKGSLPAVDVGKSVSRVGGKAQLPAYRAVADDLRLAYSQFEELEAFSRFGTGLDAATRRRLARGRRVREILKQPQYAPLSVPAQIAALVAVSEGVLDELPARATGEAERRIRRGVTANLPEICRKIEAGDALTDEMVQALRKSAAESVQELRRRTDAQGAAEEGGET